VQSAFISAFQQTDHSSMIFGLHDAVGALDHKNVCLAKREGADRSNTMVGDGTWRNHFLVGQSGWGLCQAGDFCRWDDWWLPPVACLDGLSIRFVGR